MKELIYSLVDNTNILTIKIQEAERSNFLLEPIKDQRLLTRDLLLSLQTPKDVNLISFLIEQETSYLKKTTGLAFDSKRTQLNEIHVTHQKSAELLRLFAMNGKLYFEGKSLSIDLFGKTELYYKVEGASGKPKITAHLSSGTQEYTLSSCDFIGRGPPHWFIKGMSLRVLTTELDWKELQAAREANPYPLDELIFNAKEDIAAPRVVFDGVVFNESFDPIKEREPLPVLILADRSGAFANLWMDYGEETPLVSYHDSMASGKFKKRQLVVESGWEKDLLETDFIRKQVGTTQYYCPLDKVAKSLAFLLELGWELRDWKDRVICSHQEATFSAETSERNICIKGKIKYHQFDADLTTIVGAFNRRERFVEIGPGHVALLPGSWEQFGLDDIAELGEIVGDGIQIKKHHLSSMNDLFDKQPLMKTDGSLQQLRDRLADFEKIGEALPGPDFLGTLRPYQQEGLNWLSFLYDFGFHGMLADDMGLGKTVQVLALLSRINYSSDVLIILPTSLIFNWSREIKRFLPKASVIIHHGGDRSLFSHTKPSIILTSYATLRLDLPLFLQREYSCLILDEAQAIKNSQTQTAKAIAQLDAQFRLSITGTPIENNLMELWSHFRFLLPDLLGEEATFRTELQSGQSDSRFLRRIRKQIRPFLLRRRKEEVAGDLPEKIEQVVWVEMDDDQRRLYETVLTGARKNLIEKVSIDGASKHRMEILEVIMRLRQICCHPMLFNSGLFNSGDEGNRESSKLETVIQDIATVVAEGRKVLVYSQFTSMLNLIKERVVRENWKYAYLDGSTRNREEAVTQFQDDPTTSLFLISLKAGGIGLNLTAADYVFLYDPWWNVAVENQAIDRAHRIGRKDTVVAKRYIVAESIEEKMMTLKAAKSQLADGLFDDEGLVNAALTVDDLMFLLDK